MLFAVACGGTVVGDLIFVLQLAAYVLCRNGMKLVPSAHKRILLVFRY